MNRCRYWIAIVASATVTLALRATASAATVVFDFNDPFSPNLGPGATVLRATFKDQAPNTVQLTLADVSMTSSEHVGDKGFYFNLDPAKDPKVSKLQMAFSTGQAGTSLQRGSNETDTTFKADGDGFFDFRITFASSGAGRFSAGESSVWILTGVNGQTISATDFSFLSRDLNNNQNGYLAAVHLQGTGQDVRFGGEDSLWVAPSAVVPLPAAAWMGMSLLGGVGGVGYIRRRRLAGV